MVNVAVRLYAALYVVAGVFLAAVGQLIVGSVVLSDGFLTVLVAGVTWIAFLLAGLTVALEGVAILVEVIVEDQLA